MWPTFRGLFQQEGEYICAFVCVNLNANVYVPRKAILHHLLYKDKNPSVCPSVATFLCKVRCAAMVVQLHFGSVITGSIPARVNVKLFCNGLELQ